MSKQTVIIEGESLFAKAFRLLVKLHKVKAEVLAREGAAEITEPTWRTKDGRVLRPCDFTDVHLLNTVRYIERRMDRIRDAMMVDPMPGAGLFDPESDAAYYAETAEDAYFDGALQAELEKLAPILGALTAEVERRGLAGTLELMRKDARR